MPDSESPALSAAMRLGVPAMDASHQQLLDELSAMSRANDLEFAAWYPELVAAMEQDFRVEEALMDACDPAAYPNTRYQGHLEQHARMLAGLHAAVGAVAAGDAAAGRSAIALLREWLPFHIATLDRQLAAAVPADIAAEVMRVPSVTRGAHVAGKGS